MGMKRVRTVGVKELKNNLSAFLRDVQAGAVVVVSDRSRVVAELRGRTATTLPPASHDLAREWVRDGCLVAPTSAKQPLETSPVRLPAGTSRRLLDQERHES
jgi:antitoxin (DNA-binding transcriptional repressor) of toxin-antitoxin stability system